MLSRWLGKKQSLCGAARQQRGRTRASFASFVPPPPRVPGTCSFETSTKGKKKGDASRGVTGRPKRILWPGLCFDVFWQTGAIIPAPSLKALWVLAGQPERPRWPCSSKPACQSERSYETITPPEASTFSRRRTSIFRQNLAPVRGSCSTLPVSLCGTCREAFLAQFQSTTLSLTSDIFAVSELGTCN